MAEAVPDAPPEESSDRLRGKTVCLSDVEPREISWLWSGRIPLGCVTLLVGSPGLGKSFLTTAMATTVTHGDPWPDSTPCPQGSVLLADAEDDACFTVRPRCEAAGADLKRIHLLTGAVQRGDDGQDREFLLTLADVDAIEDALKRIGDVRLVVFDPIGSFLGGGVDTHRDNEVRQVLRPLADLATRWNVAVLLVAHRRKSGTGGADESALGSRAFTGLARSVLHLTADPEDAKRRLLLAGKCNLAPPADGLAFRIDGIPARIHWDSEPVTMTADEAVRAESDRGSAPKGKREDAADWLVDFLSNGPVPATEVFRQGAKEGHSEKTLRRAASDLDVRKRKAGMDGGWLWSRHDFNEDAQEDTKLPKDKCWATSDHVGHLPVFDASFTRLDEGCEEVPL